VAHNDIFLQFFDIFERDDLIFERAETGGDAVSDFAAFEQSLDGIRRVLNLLLCIGFDLNFWRSRFALRDFDNLLDGERLPVYKNGHIYLVSSGDPKGFISVKSNPIILEEYKQINVEYNLSNIHLRDIDLDKIDSSYQNEAKKINENLNKLREIEKYTLDFEQSSTLVIIFSLEFFILFSVQYFIVLLDLKQWQILIYSIFASSILFAWLYAKKERKLYEKNNALFETLYEETLKMISKLEDKNILNKSDLIISSCDEHI